MEIVYILSAFEGHALVDTMITNVHSEGVFLLGLGDTQIVVAVTVGNTTTQKDLHPTNS